LIIAMKVHESKVSAEGRVSIPADIRHRLGLEPGGRVQFLLGEHGEVRLVTAQSLADEVWAQNTGRDAGDAGGMVREVREADARAESWEDGPFDTAENGGDDVLASLFPAA
jgi:AbrB family looped-hinge helix DNA binding protein